MITEWLSYTDVLLIFCFIIAVALFAYTEIDRRKDRDLRKDFIDGIEKDLNRKYVMKRKR